MARHYKQGRNARLDESLGMRRGKESTKKQSYKSRRDESRGMKHHNDDAHREADDTQMYHRGRDYYGMGWGEPSNLPQQAVHKKYPEPYPRLKTDYHDTLTGIDDDMMDSFRKVEDRPSDSMY